MKYLLRFHDWIEEKLNTPGDRVLVVGMMFFFLMVSMVLFSECLSNFGVGEPPRLICLPKGYGIPCVGPHGEPLPE